MFLKYKGNIYFLSVIFLLNILALIIIWSKNFNYTIDLHIYKDIVEKFDGNLLKILINNNFLLFILSKTFVFIPVEVFIRLLQSFSILLLTFVLLRYIRPYYVLSIILFTFFNLYLNQFKSAIALSLCLILFYEKNIKAIFRILVICISFLSHFFVSGFFIFSLYLQNYRFNSYKRSIYIFTLFGVVITILYIFNASFFNRYIYYFTRDNVFFSLKFLIVIILLIINFKKISQNVKFYLFIISLFLMFFSSYSSLSTRISEWVVISIFIYLSDKENFNKIIHSKESYPFFEKYNILLISLGYFIYSFINVIVFERDMSYKLFKFVTSLNNQ